MNKIKRLSLLIVILLTSNSIHAQTAFTISGYVKDSLSAEPLIGVTIADSRMRGTITNEFGFFSLTLNSSDVELSFKYLGYKTKDFKSIINSDMDLDIMLIPSTVELDEVTVEAYDNSRKLITTRALGVVSVNSQQLKYVPSFMGEKDIFKYFQLLPGVQSGKEGSSGLNMRGGSTDQTLILMDDVPIYNSTHAFGFVSIFSGDYIKSAELYKGYVPSQYGGRLSGVATMNIREGNRKEHKQSIQLGTTTFSALAEGPINGGKGSYLFGGRYFIPDLILRGVGCFVSDYTRIGFYDLTAKLSYDISPKSTLYGSFYTGRDAIYFISNYTDEDDDEIYLSGTEESNDERKTESHAKGGLDWGNITGSVRLSSKLTNKSFLNLTAYYSHLSNQKLIAYNDDAGKTLDSYIKSKMGEAGLKANIQHNINDWYNLNYGINLAYQHFIPQDIGLNRDGIKTETEYGNRMLYSGNLYLDNKFRFGNYSLNVGGRLSLYHNNKEQKIVFEPRTALTYYMKNSYLWASYVGNSQPLFSLNQQLMSLPVDYWIPFQSADELPTSQQFSVGYRHQFNFGLELQSELYYKMNKNVSIVHNSDDFLLGDSGYKLATGKAYGVELLAQYNYNRFNLMASYTYSKSMHNIEGKTVDFVYDTPHNINIFSSFETLKRETRTHTISVNINYKTGLPYILSNETYPMEGAFDYFDYFNNLQNNPTYANSRLTNFFRVDLNYTMEKKLKRGSRIWQFSILNATAHRNPYIVYYYEDYMHNPHNNEVSYKKIGYKAKQLIPFLPSFSYTRVF